MGIDDHHLSLSEAISSSCLDTLDVYRKCLPFLCLPKNSRENALSKPTLLSFCINEIAEYIVFQGSCQLGKLTDGERIRSRKLHVQTPQY